MKVRYFRGNIGDELWPNCGCGWRTIEVTIGHKWVRAREAVQWHTPRKRISRRVWDAMCNNKRLPLVERDKPKHLRKRKRK